MIEWIDSAWIYTITSVCLIISVVVTLGHAYLHLLNFCKPYVQSHVLRILLVTPIYAIGAFLSFVAPKSEFIMTCICDIWEAMVVYSFVLLIVEYMGGEHHCMAEMSGKEDGDVPQIWPLNKCFPPVQQSQMIRLPKRLALQFVLLKPVMAFTNIIVYYVYDESYPTTYSLLTKTVYNTSYTLALAGLFLLFSATHDLPNLKDKRLVSKFLSVKGVVFLTYWQALAFNFFLAGREDEHRMKQLQNFVLSVESAVFTLALTHAFWYTEFRTKIAVGAKIVRSPTAGPCGAVSIDLYELRPGRGQAGESSLKSGSDIDTTNAQNEAPTNMPPKTAVTETGSKEKEEAPLARALKNARSAFNPTDVFVDAKQSFSRRYAHHVILEDERESEIRDFADKSLETKTLETHDTPTTASPV